MHSAPQAAEQMLVRSIAAQPYRYISHGSSWMKVGVRVRTVHGRGSPRAWRRAEERSACGRLAAVFTWLGAGLTRKESSSEQCAVGRRTIGKQRSQDSGSQRPKPQVAGGVFGAAVGGGQTRRRGVEAWGQSCSCPSCLFNARPGWPLRAWLSAAGAGLGSGGSGSSPLGSWEPRAGHG